MLEVLTIEEFNEFSLNHSQSTFFQTPYWCDFKKSLGWSCYLLGLKIDGKVICATLIIGKKVPLIGKYLYYAPRGFLVDYKNQYYLEKFINEIKVFLRKNKGIYLKINPYYEYQKRTKNGIILDGTSNKDVIDKLEHLGFKHEEFNYTYKESMEPKFLSILNLENKTEDEILGNMFSNAKLKISNSYKHGLKLIEIDKTRMNEFKKLMDLEIIRSLEYYNKLYDSFSRENKAKFILVELNIDEYLDNLINQRQELLLRIAENKTKEVNNNNNKELLDLGFQVEAIQNRLENLNILKSEKGNKIITAGGLFITVGSEVVSFFTSKYEEYNNFNSMYFLHFKMIKYALNNNYNKYNFYGIAGDFSSDSKEYEMFNFRREFDADVVELIGEFTLILSKFNYELYKLVYKLFYKRRVKK